MQRCVRLDGLSFAGCQSIDIVLNRPRLKVIQHNYVVLKAMGKHHSALLPHMCSNLFYVLVLTQGPVEISKATERPTGRSMVSTLNYEAPLEAASLHRGIFQGRAVHESISCIHSRSSLLMLINFIRTPVKSMQLGIKPSFCSSCSCT